MTWLKANYDEMDRVFNEMMSQMSRWTNVTNQTSPEYFATLSVSSHTVMELSKDFLSLTNRAIDQTLLRLKPKESTAWSPALVLVPGMSGALRVSMPSALVTFALVTAMTVQGCSGCDTCPGCDPCPPYPIQQVYDLLLKISGNMGTAMDQVDGLNRCAASRVSCSDDEVNDLTATAKADFSRLQVAMRELGNLVNSKETMSGPVPAVHPRANSSMEVPHALLLQEGELHFEAQ